MNNLLLAGFEPYRGRKINNSWEVVKHFSCNEYTYILKIPLSFTRGHPGIIAALKEQNYNYVVIVGETSFTNDYERLERLAINYKDSNIHDNDGEIVDDVRLIENAPNAYFTKLP